MQPKTSYLHFYQTYPYGYVNLWLFHQKEYAQGVLFEDSQKHEELTEQPQLSHCCFQQFGEILVYQRHLAVIFSNEGLSSGLGLVEELLEMCEAG